MGKLIAPIAAMAIIVGPALARDKNKEEKRLENSGVVLKEILDIPDDIPADLLNKAECVAIFPSVLRVAIGIGGSYGRGVMTCRTGEHYTGRWSAPSMMALEGANIGFQWAAPRPILSLW
jgi:SH3 domain-containing YSC84-like protein 1